MPATSKETDRAAIILGTISLLGSIITAYFGFRASSRPVETIISATQTAEAKALISVPPFIQITPLPTNVPQAVTATNASPQRVLPDNAYYVGQSFNPLQDDREVIVRVEYVQIVNDRVIVYIVFDAANVTEAKTVYWCGVPTLKKAGVGGLGPYTDIGGAIAEPDVCNGWFGIGGIKLTAPNIYDNWIGYRIDPTTFDIYGLYELSGLARIDPIVFEVLP